MSYDIQVIYHNSYLVSVSYHVHPGMQFCFCMYATKTLEKQKQNFTLYRSTVLLLCVYYKNACKSKSKTSPSTGVQFCFCMYTTKRLQKQKQNFALYRSTVLLLYEYFAARFEATTLVGVHPRLRMEERHGFVSTLVANTSFAAFLGNNPATTPLTT